MTQEELFSIKSISEAQRNFVENIMSEKGQPALFVDKATNEEYKSLRKKGESHFYLHFVRQVADEYEFNLSYYSTKGKVTRTLKGFKLTKDKFRWV